MIAVEQQFTIKQSFKLLADEACYLLSVEIQMPIDVITLQATVPIMLLDVESNKAMVSRTEADEKVTEHLLPPRGSSCAVLFLHILCCTLR